MIIPLRLLDCLGFEIPSLIPDFGNDLVASDCRLAWVFGLGVGESEVCRIGDLRKDDGEGIDIVSMAGG